MCDTAMSQNSAMSAKVPQKRPTLRQDLEQTIKSSVDFAAKAQKALMTLPTAILDQDANELANHGIYFNTGYPF